MYQKVDTNLNFTDREKEVLQYWKDNDIFKKSMEIRRGSKPYVFYDGPPTANGKPHIGHVLTRVIKDIIPRYKTMKGYMVPRKAGWDTHGLPVELEVEKYLGLDGKDQIEEYGLDPFISKCKESVWTYKGMWEDFSDTVGFWADMDNPYVTYHDDYIESEWWALKEMWERELLYKGFKIVPYCPRCGTPLSSHEVAQGYKDVKEKSAIVRFKVVNEDAYILAWTTTPWTLPSNVGLCVNPKEDYVRVRAADGYTYYMAKALLDTVLGSLGEYSIEKEYKGIDLEHMEYEPLFPFVNDIKANWKTKAHYVTVGDFVTLSDGTGVVHMAPAFGEDDMAIGRKYELPFVQLVDSKGEMTEDTPWAGVFCKEADKIILKDLEGLGLLFNTPVFEHSYPHCWRCDTPLIYYARESWFIMVTAVKDELIANNKTINWLPPSIGTGRFGDWLENVQDWGISRDRFWGTPLNIWECECGHMDAIGSREELVTRSGNPDAQTVEFHRPYIDNITIKCDKCGGRMNRVPEVIDCWFDSGAMPYAQHHYPFENKELFDKEFPAQFISEAVDQTRGWFYSLLVESTILFHKSSFENVIVMGHVQDKDGKKMSKSKGNAIDPFEVLNEYGADAVRWYFYINSAPWLPNRFHGDAVLEGQRKYMGTLWNTYAFYVLYADIDSFNPKEHRLDIDTLTVMDKWIISKLNTLIKVSDDNLSNYKITETARALLSFVDDLSNWYIRRTRDRFWAKGMEQDKINAYLTLYECLEVVARLSAPMVPFISEAIYQNIVRTVDNDAPISIHLCDYPAANDDKIDIVLEEQMDEALKIAVMGRACRNSASIKNRQPIGLMIVKSPFVLDEYFAEIVKEELNIKSIDFCDDVREYTTYSFKPQLKTVGPKYGKLLGGIKQHLDSLDGNAAMGELKDVGYIRFEVSGNNVELSEEDLLISMEHKDGYVSEADNRITVVIKTDLSEELIEEGYVLEIISKIQTMRKDADYEVTDNIHVSICGNPKIAKIVSDNSAIIGGKVLAIDIADERELSNMKEWNINGEKVVIGIQR